METYTFRFGELFCGPGGLAYGATKAKLVHGGVQYNVSTAWATDIDKDSCETFRRNICPNNPEKVIAADIKKLDISKLPQIDALAFGFPCNDFSMVGEQKGVNGRYGALYRYGVKALEEHNPLWFVAENVSGLRSANDGRVFIQILDELREAGFGYELTTHLYRFENYGVPQTRHRIIIVGIRSDLELKFRVPAPTTPLNRRTAWDALCDPPIRSEVPNNEVTRQSQQVVERLRFIPPGSNAWNSDIPEHLQLNVPKVRMSHIYRRLDPHKPSYTITGSGGGGTHVYHWTEDRALTNRERARLQTFPDHFVFEGSKESVRKQIGMAVPPHGAVCIVTAILKTFAHGDYISVSENIESPNHQLEIL